MSWPGPAREAARQEAGDGAWLAAGVRASGRGGLKLAPDAGRTRSRHCARRSQCQPDRRSPTPSRPIGRLHTAFRLGLRTRALARGSSGSRSPDCCTGSHATCPASLRPANPAEGSVKRLDSRAAAVGPGDPVVGCARKRRCDQAAWMPCPEVWMTDAGNFGQVAVAARSRQLGLSRLWINPAPSPLS